MPVPGELLTHITCLQKLSLQTLDQLSSSAEMVNFKSGSALYEQGDAPTGLYILLSGWVKLYRHSRGHVQILALLKSGQCCGAESLATSSPSPCAASALTPAQMLYLSPPTVLTLSNQHPDFLELLLELTSARLKQFVSLVHDLAFRDVSARLASVLVARAIEDGRRTERGICIERLLSQQDFAALIGTAREVIYRTFRKFEEEAIIHLTTQEICILDLDRLVEIASEENR